MQSSLSSGEVRSDEVRTEEVDRIAAASASPTEALSPSEGMDTTAQQNDGGSACGGERAFRRFRDALWDRPDVALKKVESGRLIAEQLCQLIRERVSIEETHALALQKWATKFPRNLHYEGASFTHGFDAVVKDAERTAEQGLIFVGAVREEVAAQLSETCRNHSRVLKTIQGDVNRFQQTLQKYVTVHDKSMMRYERSAREADAAALFYQGSERALPSARVKAALKALKLCKEATAAQEQYASATESLNAAHKTYREQMCVVLDALEDMDVKRMECVRGALTKLVVYQTSYIRNVQYDIAAAIEGVEAMSSSSDLDQFIELNRSEVPPNVPHVPELMWPALTEMKLAKANGDSHAAGIAPGTLPPTMKVPLVQSTSLTPTTSDSGVAALEEQTSSIQLDSMPPKGAQEGSLREAIVPDPPRVIPEREEPVPSSGAQTREGRPPDTWATTAGNSAPLPKLEGWHNHASRYLRMAVEAVEQKRQTSKSLAAQQTMQGGSIVPSATTAAPASGISAWSALSTTYGGGENAPVEALNDVAVMDIEILYNTLLDCIWKNEGIHAAKVSTEELVFGLEQPLRRTLFLKALNKKKTKKLWKLPSRVALRELASLCKAILDYSDAQFDVCSARTVAGLSSIFFAIETKGNAADSAESDHRRGDRRVFLQALLYSHQIWNRVQFWEEALTLFLSEALQHRHLTQRWSLRKAEDFELEERQLRETNPCAGMLYNFGPIMTSFGISHAAVRDLIARICLTHDVPPELLSILLESAVDGSGGATGENIEPSPSLPPRSCEPPPEAEPSPNDPQPSETSSISGYVHPLSPTKTQETSQDVEVKTLS